MPADNIKRAIQKGTGELEGGQLEELQYEGYGPSGVALIVEVVTDNRNRTVSEIRHVFSKNGGNMGESGSVAWMFHKKGYIAIGKSKADEETLMTLAIDAGAGDLSRWRRLCFGPLRRHPFQTFRAPRRSPEVHVPRHRRNHS